MLFDVYGATRTVGACKLAIVKSLRFVCRARRGTAASAHASEMIDRLEPLAELGWAQAVKAGAR